MPITIFRRILRLSPVALLIWSLGASANAAPIRPEASAKLTYQNSPQIYQRHKLKGLASGLKLLSTRQLLTAARILGSATGTERLLAQQIVIVQGSDLKQQQRYQVYDEHSRLADEVILRQVAELCLLPGLASDGKLEQTGPGRLLRATREVRAGYIVLPAASADDC